MIVRRIGESEPVSVSAGEAVGPIMGQTYDDLLTSYQKQRKLIWVVGGAAAVGLLGWILYLARRK